MWHDFGHALKKFLRDKMLEETMAICRLLPDPSTNDWRGGQTWRLAPQSMPRTSIQHVTSEQLHCKSIRQLLILLHTRKHYTACLSECSVNSVGSLHPLVDIRSAKCIAYMYFVQQPHPRYTRLRPSSQQQSSVTDKETSMSVRCWVHIQQISWKW